VHETMVNAMTLDVPIQVDLKAGKNWLDTDPVSVYDHGAMAL